MSTDCADDVFMRFMIASLPSGPHVTAPTAAAVVRRLRRTDEWVKPYVQRLSHLPEAASTVIKSPIEIVERRAAATVCFTALRQLVTGQSLNIRPTALYKTALWGRTTMRHVTGIWDMTRNTRVLVAPNIFTQAQQFQLDQNDWCRWVSLRTALTATHHIYAPHLIEYLIHLMSALPDTTHELAHFIFLSDALAYASMDALTPVDMPSCQWLRHYDKKHNETARLHVLRKILTPPPDISVICERTQNFADYVVAARMLPELLRDVANLPTVAEYAQPDMWGRRVG
ncbi:hypothetical protein [Schaalia sp. lx-100]|uniref:hypothetical protein n=1 Tax=Schaalia sp. lx-100 TaxID=2899081 RepID=UPI001E58FBDC|nr:hypothetical protein [Schaalia sp. lx-100]MCD4557662.1 hypothetical protein [Schaalia sp. lx-100]